MKALPMARRCPTPFSPSSGIYHGPSPQLRDENGRLILPPLPSSERRGERERERDERDDHKKVGMITMIAI